MKIELSQQEAQAILNYLGTKPYSEVFQIIALIQSKAIEKPLKEKKDDKESGKV